jgi:hypothetical protein
MGITHKIAIVSVLLGLATPAFAAELTATPAQWKDIHKLQETIIGCGGTTPQNRRGCALFNRLQNKLAKQGFCFFRRIEVGRLAWHGPEKDMVPTVAGQKQCYALHDPHPPRSPH